MTYVQIQKSIRAAGGSAVLFEYTVRQFCENKNVLDNKSHNKFKLRELIDIILECFVLTVKQKEMIMEAKKHRDKIVHGELWTLAKNLTSKNINLNKAGVVKLSIPTNFNNSQEFICNIVKDYTAGKGVPVVNTKELVGHAIEASAIDGIFGTASLEIEKAIDLIDNDLIPNYYPIKFDV
jgi:hypothetical protein